MVVAAPGGVVVARGVVVIRAAGLLGTVERCQSGEHFDHRRAGGGRGGIARRGAGAARRKRGLGLTCLSDGPRGQRWARLAVKAEGGERAHWIGVAGRGSRVRLRVVGVALVSWICRLT